MLHIIYLLLFLQECGLKKISKKCVKFYKKHNIQYSLLLANSTYPAPYEDIGLNFLQKLKTLSNIVGYSGHERGILFQLQQ